MFSGYGQSQAMTEQIFSAIERHMEERYQKYSVFETIEDWTSADVHRLVSAFLGTFLFNKNVYFVFKLLELISSLLYRGEISNGTSA